MVARLESSQSAQSGHATHGSEAEQKYTLHRWRAGCASG
jgi:hypothetical protein